MDKYHFYIDFGNQQIMKMCSCGIYLEYRMGFLCSLCVCVCVFVILKREYCV